MRKISLTFKATYNFIIHIIKTRFHGILEHKYNIGNTLLEDLGIKAAMPSFIKKGEKQMSDIDANTSRK